MSLLDLSIIHLLEHACKLTWHLLQPSSSNMVDCHKEVPTLMFTSQSTQLATAPNNSSSQLEWRKTVLTNSGDLEDACICDHGSIHAS
jgi:hypothetical protein